jgi:hypothetical protein
MAGFDPSSLTLFEIEKQLEQARRDRSIALGDLIANGLRHLSAAVPSIKRLRFRRSLTVRPPANLPSFLPPGE